MKNRFNKITEPDEIDFIGFFKKIYSNKKLILKISFLSLLLGVVYALSLSNQFTSSTTFIPQLNSSDSKSGTSSISGLASLAGIKLKGIEDSSEIPPTLYPQVVGSVPFNLSLLSSSIKINNEKILVREYLSAKASFDPIGFIKKYTIGLPSLIFGTNNNNNKIISNSKIYNISYEDYLLFNTLRSTLVLSINDKEGFITMSYTDENKHVAAQIAQIAQSLLQKSIIEYKVQSSEELLEFTLNQYNEKKNDFEILQDKRALFVDNNINISSSLYQNKLSRIESELNISEAIVQQLASQVEQAKLQVNKNTPVFTIIQPANAPFLRSSPKRTRIVLSFLFIGFVTSCGYILVKEPLNEIYRSIKS